MRTSTFCWRAPASSAHCSAFRITSLSEGGGGLPFVGLATGNVGKIKDGEQIHEFSYVWRPRFGEACDLYAVGMLLFESLLSHDERPLDRLRQAILTDLEELTGACRGGGPGRRGPDRERGGGGERGDLGGGRV